MRKQIILILSSLWLILVIASGAFSQTTAFTYQGSLRDGANPANGNYDLEFKLFDAVSAGTQQGITLQRLNVAVANGIFTVSLDFGAITLPGADRFLDIAVRPSGGGAFTPLTPRQHVNSAPYSVKSLNSTTADVATNATQLGGVAANQYVTTTTGGTSFIQNTTTQQASSNFSISNDGFINGSGGVGTSSNTFLGTPARFTVVQQQPGQWAGHFGTNNFAAGNSFGLLLDAGTNITDDAFRIRNQGGTSQFFSVKGNGFVGLGTANPNSHFHVQANAPQGLAFQMENTDTAKRLYIGNYGTIGGGNHWPGLDSANTSLLYAENPLVFTTPGGIYFSGSTSAEHMRIGTNGNVGINMNPGSSRFAVNHVTPNAFAAYIKTTGIPTASSYGLLVEAGTDTTDSALQVNSQSGSPLLRVRGDGRVGIGTTNPTEKFEVAGNSRLDGDVRVTGSQRIDGQLFVESYLNNGTDPVCFAGIIIAACLSSSIRYKSNIGTYLLGLDGVRQLQPVAFDWKSNGTRDLGLNAEDVQRIDPLLVTYNKDGQVERVKYDRISVVLVNAVKEQQAQIEAQQKKIEALTLALCSLKPDLDVCKTN